MILLCYPKCSTCQATINEMNSAGVVYENRNIKEDNPSYEELKKWYEKSRLPLKRFFNTSGLIYKSMNLKEKLANMSEDEQLRLLASDGMLVRRPILIDGEHVFVGKKDILENVIK